MLYQLLLFLRGFVALSDIDPTIHQHLLYTTRNNFVGERIYKVPKVYLKKNAALSLTQVQKYVNMFGYDLVVYDGYMPMSAVEHFYCWADVISENDKNAGIYFPRLTKEQIRNGGVAAKRYYSTGYRVSVSLIKKGNKPHAPITKRTILNNGEELIVMDDGTENMGTSFDIHHKASTMSGLDLISERCLKARMFLKHAMEKYGFVGSKHAWWHFGYLESHPGAYKDRNNLIFEMQTAKRYNYDIE